VLKGLAGWLAGWLRRIGTFGTFFVERGGASAMITFVFFRDLCMCQWCRAHTNGDLCLSVDWTVDNPMATGPDRVRWNRYSHWHGRYTSRGSVRHNRPQCSMIFLKSASCQCYRMWRRAASVFHQCIMVGPIQSSLVADFSHLTLTVTTAPSTRVAG
jgi:hypothetical protein